MRRHNNERSNDRRGLLLCKMADPSAIVPYHDPYETSFTDDIFNFINHPNPTFADLSLFGEPGPYPCPTDNINHSRNSQSDHVITDALDSLDDPLFWEIANNSNYHIGESSQAGPSGNHAETSNPGWPETENLEDTRAFPIWPIPPEPFSCSCCLVLREIIHSNSHETTKLEIHGRLGLICHGILEFRQSNNGSRRQHMIEKSIENVKEDLVYYCEERKREGYVMLPDPLSCFYETVCVGLDLDDNLSTDDYPLLPMTNSGDNEMNQTELGTNTERIPRTSLAAQRMRTGKLTLRDLVIYFNLPIEEAARRMKLCPTVLKKICRRYGLPRWPFRKIKSIERRMSLVSARLNSDDAEERTNAEAEMQRLRQQMAAASGGLYGFGMGT